MIMNVIKKSTQFQYISDKFKNEKRNKINPVRFKRILPTYLKLPVTTICV